MNKDPETASGHYIHQVSYSYRERMVGFFVFSGLILLLLFIVISVKNQHLFERRVIFYIELDSSEGINQGSLVTVLGAEAGRVSGLSLAPNQKIRVAIEVYEGQHGLIRQGAKVIVNRLTNIGNALIEIRSDSIDAPMLADGTTLPVEETPSLNDLLLGLANIVRSADSNNLLSKFELILPKVEQTLENVHEIIAQIASGHGTLGAAVFDQQVEHELKIVVKSGAEILTEAEGIVSVAKQRLVEMGPVLTDVKYVTHDLRGATQSLPDMVLELNEIITQANIAMTLINQELGQIPGVAVDTRKTLSKANRLIDSVQNTWPLSNKIQQPAPKQLIPPHPFHD
ncbi:MAG: MlaD family protein [Methylococcaceae bacterium]|nr:MlaD family protein [Methylococcaceae bacterium]